ncbi:hypothetical protein LZ554_000472 [Drepanopeziza brunnea f. sp. 'monogermtubi']|nr:hypothetical protein LZ554_000472 [Drepanopeziza brunnea f. sp. 'monogermtubi']
MADSIEHLPGGFLPSLPSPSPSTVSTAPPSNLPHPRRNPLKAGSAKEDALRRYADRRLLVVGRRYAKKFLPLEAGDEVKGYEGFGEVAKDLGELIDVLWLSGTPSLQIPYLLNVALAVTSYITAFPFSPKATFVLLGKLDHVFSSLLKGEDCVSGEILPGFSGGMRAGLSLTHMVRCKGLVEATRVLVVDVMGRSGKIETEGEDEDEDDAGTGADWEMEAARVYEMTIMRLGESLGEGFAVPGAGAGV